MAVAYHELIQRNPITPWALHGFGRSTWCFATVLVDASVKRFQIDVYGNTPSDSMFYAQQLKTYLETNKIDNNDVSIGIRQPTYDRISQAYMSTLMMDVGNLWVPTGSPFVVDCSKHVGRDDGRSFDTFIDTFWCPRCILFNGTVAP